MSEVTLTSVLHALVKANILTQDQITQIKTADNLAQILVRRKVIKVADIKDPVVMEIVLKIAQKLCCGEPPRSIITEYKNFFKQGDMNDEKRDLQCVNSQH